MITKATVTSEGTRWTNERNLDQPERFWSWFRTRAEWSRSLTKAVLSPPPDRFLSPLLKFQSIDWSSSDNGLNHSFQISISTPWTTGGGLSWCVKCRLHRACQSAETQIWKLTNDRGSYLYDKRPRTIIIAESDHYYWSASRWPPHRPRDNTKILYYSVLKRILLLGIAC